MHRRAAGGDADGLSGRVGQLGLRGGAAGAGLCACALSARRARQLMIASQVTSRTTVLTRFLLLNSSESIVKE